MLLSPVSSRCNAASYVWLTLVCNRWRRANRRYRFHATKMTKTLFFVDRTDSARYDDENREYHVHYSSTHRSQHRPIKMLQFNCEFYVPANNFPQFFLKLLKMHAHTLPNDLEGPCTIQEFDDSNKPCSISTGILFFEVVAALGLPGIRYNDRP